MDKHRKLLIIGLDGLRPDALRVADTPAIDSLASEGSYAWDAESEPVTVSGSAWTSLLTGVYLDKHRVVGNEFRWRERAYRTFFALAREEYPDMRKGNGDLFFVHLDDIDGAGHKHGYGPESKGYVKAVATAVALSKNRLIVPGPIRHAEGEPFRIVDLVPLFSRFLGLKDQNYWDGVTVGSYET